MQRRFTKDVGKNFKKGSVHDFPFTTWTDITRGGGFSDMEDFSTTITDIGPDEKEIIKKPKGGAGKKQNLTRKKTSKK